MITKSIKIIVTAAVCAGFIASCAPKAVNVGKDAPPPAEKKERPPKTAKPGSDSGAQISYGGRIVTPDQIIADDMKFADSLRHVDFEQLDDPHAKRDPPVIETEKPVPGGKAKIYLQRGFMDDVVADMIRLNPFDDGHGNRIFKVTDSTHRRLELTLAGQIKRANGHRANALDFVELWSRFLKARPAQGLAMFRNVQGAENFVNGKDPLVNGFNAADENTVRIRFAKPDPLAFHRMNSPKLIGGPFLLGAYYSGGAKDAQMKLLPNANCRSATALLSECAVQMGGDPDALASFASGKYSAMTLYLASEIETAKTEFEAEGRASLRKLPSDRYFLACRTEDAEVRKFVRKHANGADLLRNHVRAEGEEITSIMPQNETAETPRGGISIPMLSKPFRIIYREDDPISKIVAEKVLADLGVTGMLVDASPQTAEKYETTLVNGRYDCAVGWVPDIIFEDFTEQLHLASMWFNDETDPRVRLREYREIPLFSVNNYLLIRNDIRLHEDRVSGMWVNTPGE